MSCNRNDDKVSFVKLGVNNNYYSWVITICSYKRFDRKNLYIQLPDIEWWVVFWDWVVSRAYIRGFYRGLPRIYILIYNFLFSGYIYLRRHSFNRVKPYLTFTINRGILSCYFFSKTPLLMSTMHRKKTLMG